MKAIYIYSSAWWWQICTYCRKLTCITITNFSEQRSFLLPCLLPINTWTLVNMYSLCFLDRGEWEEATKHEFDAWRSQLWNNAFSAIWFSKLLPSECTTTCQSVPSTGPDGPPASVRILYIKLTYLWPCIGRVNDLWTSLYFLIYFLFLCR